MQNKFETLESKIEEAKKGGGEKRIESHASMVLLIVSQFSIREILVGFMILRQS